MLSSPTSPGPACRGQEEGAGTSATGSQPQTAEQNPEDRAGPGPRPPTAGRREAGTCTLHRN